MIIRTDEPIELSDSPIEVLSQPGADTYKVEIELFVESQIEAMMPTLSGEFRGTWELIDLDNRAHLGYWYVTDNGQVDTTELAGRHGLYRFSGFVSVKDNFNVLAAKTSPDNNITVVEGWMEVTPISA